MREPSEAYKGVVDRTYTRDTATPPAHPRSLEFERHIVLIELVEVLFDIRDELAAANKHHARQSFVG